MPDTVTLTAFLIVAVTMAASPGPAVLYTVARGMHQGRASALVSMLGIEVGERLVGSARVVAAQRYITGSVYVGLAATTGLTAAGL